MKYIKVMCYKVVVSPCPKTTGRISIKFRIPGHMLKVVGQFDFGPYLSNIRPGVAQSVYQLAMG
jgi:hypothetical protein